MFFFSSLHSILSSFTLRWFNSCFNFPNGSLIARKDLRDIFDQLSVTRKSKITLNSDKSRSAPELFHIPEKRKIGKPNMKMSMDYVWVFYVPMNLEGNVRGGWLV